MNTRLATVDRLAAALIHVRRDDIHLWHMPFAVYRIAREEAVGDLRAGPFFSCSDKSAQNTGNLVNLMNTYVIGVAGVGPNGANHADAEPLLESWNETADAHAFATRRERLWVAVAHAWRAHEQ